MSKRSLCLMLLVSVFLPVVYSKNPFFEYFYNKYHKHSSTANTLSSVTEFSSTAAISSLDDHSSEENSSADDKNLSSPTITFNEGANISYPSIILHDDTTDYSIHSSFATIFSIVIGSFIAIVLCLACLGCCRAICCSTGSERRGFIMSNNREERGIEVNPQPIITQYPSSPAGYVIQHCPPESSQAPIQQFPAQYDQPTMSQYNQHPAISQYNQHPAMPQYHQQELLPQNQQQAVQPQIPYVPMQPEFQYSPDSMHFQNPPEAPPPYAPTAPTKF